MTSSPCILRGAGRRRIADVCRISSTDGGDELEDGEESEAFPYADRIVGRAREVSTHNSLSAFQGIRILTNAYGHIGRAASMKQKLTITVDAELLPIAKRYARARRVAFLADRAVSQGGDGRAWSVLRFAVARPVSGGRA